jgi:5-deoxy-glucuronate isomerase
MTDLVRSFDNANKPIVVPGGGLLQTVYFNLVRLNAGESYTARLPGIEAAYVVHGGCCDISVDGTVFQNVGRRADLWSGMADSVYAGEGATVRIEARAGRVEIAVAGGTCSNRFPPFRITPEDVEIVDVGSPETHSHRRICHILGHNGRGRAGNLLVSELYCDAGCWAGYPPHKHDEDAGAEESAHEELYHFRFRPETGFGVQLSYENNGTPRSFVTQNGDTFLLDRGYHPNTTSPGHEEYVFTILVGRTQRSLVQNFDVTHRHLLDKIPGIAAMQDKFK